MDHEHTQHDVTTGTDRDRRYDDESVQRSGATFLFWFLVVLLVCLGICVLVSIALALIYGS